MPDGAGEVVDMGVRTGAGTAKVTGISLAPRRADRQ